MVTKSALVQRGRWDYANTTDIDVRTFKFCQYYLYAASFSLTACGHSSTNHSFLLCRSSCLLAFSEVVLISPFNSLHFTTILSASWCRFSIRSICSPNTPIYFGAIFSLEDPLFFDLCVEDAQYYFQ